MNTEVRGQLRVYQIHTQTHTLSHLCSPGVQCSTCPECNVPVSRPFIDCKHDLLTDKVRLQKNQKPTKRSNKTAGTRCHGRVCY